ncbi:MAG: flagellar basal-body rod protein FlgG [Desulfobulbaceae bacterium]|nr:flagellar basal-body rod protein FlgG [Desulfobulbaceae bacterium]MCK5437302.1 flagellar basal-body rod protein FlgG [Desulfobulbaceae bacterium]MCK5545125.1 flagellar basal-body rod protein FlgG [Desulfobulbaceae bacterium]
MIRSLYSARTGLIAQELQLDVISNNLANVNTSGFKKSRAHFEDLFYQTLRQAGVDTAGGGQVPTGIQIGLGVRPTSVQKIFTQGDYADTGNELDFSIEGKGFFQILRDGEEYYTRAGAFKRDGDGYIVTANGDRLQPEFAIPEGTTNVAVDSGGLLVAQDASMTTLGSVQITLHNFINPAGLKSMGGNLFTETEASGQPVEANPGIDGMGTIAQRYLETSNVDVTEEMVNLIITQRAFEVNSKAITTADQLLEIANSLKR